MKRWRWSCARWVGVGLAVLGQTTAESQPSQAEPRIAPIAQSPMAWPDDVRDGVRTFGVEPEAATPLIRTLARHPAALHGIDPLAGYIRSRAMATAVDQVLLGLRTAWLCRSEAVWVDQVKEARALGISEAEILRVAEGPDAGWGGSDVTVIRAADEIYRDGFLGDQTWELLSTRYNAQQLIDVIFTGAEYTMLSMLANSFGVHPDLESTIRMPRDVATDSSSSRVRHPSVRLKTARLEPIPMTEWTSVQRDLLDPDGTGGPTLNLYTTLARHPVFYRPRAIQSRYIRTGSTLSGRVREMLILRTGWLCGAEYEWAQHVKMARREGLTDDEIADIARGPRAPGWEPLEAALLTAADELHRDDTISDETWGVLSAAFDEPELIDVVITVAGYKMVSIASNSLGVQLEPGLTGFPEAGRP